MNARRSWIAILASAVLVAACSQAAMPSDIPASMPAPSATPVPSVPATPSPDPSFEALVAEGIRVRAHYGLRADEDWVRQVSNDPDARLILGIPMTSAEETQLTERPVTDERLLPALDEYGQQYPSEFAGVRIDYDPELLLVVLVTDHLEEHQAGIAKLVHPEAPVEVKLAPVTEKDLEVLMERISADEDALRSLGIMPLGISVKPDLGEVWVDVSTERADAQHIFVERYGDNVQVEVIDPTGAYFKPTGEVRGRIVDQDGRGLRGNVGSVPLFAENLPLDSIGPPETDADGAFRLMNMLPGEWRLTALLDGVEAARTDVDVPPGDVVTVELVVNR